MVQGASCGQEGAVDHACAELVVPDGSVIAVARVELILTAVGIGRVLGKAIQNALHHKGIPFSAWPTVTCSICCAVGGPLAVDYVRAVEHCAVTVHPHLTSRAVAS